MLIAYNESGAPGSESPLVWYSLPMCRLRSTLPNPTVTKTRWVSFQTSVEGTFQVLATVPLNTPQGPHRFIAQIGAKSASAPFNVTPGMSLKRATRYRKNGLLRQQIDYSDAGPTSTRLVLW